MTCSDFSGVTPRLRSAALDRGAGVGHEEVLHDERGPKDRRRKTQLADALLDPPFRFEVRDTGGAVRAADAGVDEMCDPGGVGGLGERHALGDLGG